MKLFRHWARATADVNPEWTLTRYAGSNVSLHDAERQAEALVRATADRVRAANLGAPTAAGLFPPDALDLDRYTYGDRPAREEIVKTSDDGGATWAITRNAYGALVLNAAQALFADIDDETRGNAGGGFLGRLFGKRASTSDALADRLAPIVESRRLGGRLYRTAAGHRLLVTNRTFDPVDAESEALLRDVGSDPLYTALCRAQESFRARVSPKYWRCGAGRPPCRYPWLDERETSAYRAWERTYHDRADTHATCTLVGEIGAAGVHDAIAPVLDVHDSLACLPGASLA